ncbi:MAG: polysaccharide deacetylase family protein [Pseudomonadota bacterium]
MFSVLGSDPALAAKLRRIERTQALTILNLHRVSSDASSIFEALPPALFDELLAWAKAHFAITTCAGAAASEDTDKPRLILSFDDGYKDFIKTVMPILDRHKIRANQNIIPGAVERGEPPINVLVQDFIAQAPASLLREVRLPGVSFQIDPENRFQAATAVSALYKNRPMREQHPLREQLDAALGKVSGFRPTPMMTVDEVREAARHHEVGAHAFEHASMAFETNDYLADDARRCRVWFHQQLGISPDVYALPNGSYRPGQPQIVRDAGYNHVLLVGDDFSSPRATVHKRFTARGRSLAEAKFRASGGFVRPQDPAEAVIGDRA